MHERSQGLPTTASRFEMEVALHLEGQRPYLTVGMSKGFCAQGRFTWEASTTVWRELFLAGSINAFWAVILPPPLVPIDRPQLSFVHVVFRSHWG